MIALRPYQVPHAQKLFAALQHNGSALDASDTGTGKMYVASFLASQMGVTPLVVAPKSTLIKWRQVAASFNIEIEAVNYEKIRGMRPRGDDEAPAVAQSEWGREMLCSKGSRWQWNQPYELVILDEVHRCAGMTSLNSKLLIAARRQARHVLCLSATAADDPRDMKALGYALGLFDMPQFRWWLLAHGCEPGIWGGFDLDDDPTVVRRGMSKIHSLIFNGRGARMRKSLIPDFPKTQIDVQLVEDETGKADTLTENALNAYRGRHLEKLMEARQKIELLKVPYFVDMAQDYARSSKVIIFVNFKRTIDTLREKLKHAFDLDDVPVIDGENTDIERAAIVDDFQSGRIPVLICNNEAGGEGISLHDPTGKEERTCLISPSFKAKQMKQVLGRPQRDGGAFSRQFLIYFAGTVEERVAAAVETGLRHIDILNDNMLNGVLA